MSKEWDFEDIPNDSKTGAIIRFNDSYYIDIRGEIFIPYHFKKKKWYKSDAIPLNKFEFKFPANINAVYESIDGYFYFIQKDKYCKRKLKVKQPVSF